MLTVKELIAELLEFNMCMPVNFGCGDDSLDFNEITVGEPIDGEPTAFINLTK